MKKLVKIMVSVLVAILMIGGGRFFYLGSQSTKMNPKLGVVDERLTPCPDKPNCVSSFGNKEQYIDPLVSQRKLEEIKNLILKLDNVKLISQTQNYLHFTFASSLFNFTDDLEIYFVDKKYHIRSSSRVGYSDLGANRKRVEKLREILRK